MNAVIAEAPAITQIRRADLPAPGEALGGGFFLSLYRNGDEIRALIAAPKAEGEVEDMIWAPKNDLLAGALSFTDGLANTDAMAAAGSELAIKFRALRIGGADDWCLPALDQIEVAYRIAKPTAEENACWAGANINAHPVPTQRYIPDSPAQTTIAIFREGGAESFETDNYYRTSTQYAGNPVCAWITYFVNGGQGYSIKSYGARARAVRSILVIE